ncbi:MAG: HPr family phosphocarrier protein [Clostridiaceae bacterium]|nr:HPr family phosphocarrier protein [Clostridiaceae bacterium]
MEKFQIQFSDLEDVHKFVHVVSGYDADVDLYCGSYCVDAKSIMGIMTMDIRNPMWVSCNCGIGEGKRLMNDLEWLAVA